MERKTIVVPKDKKAQIALDHDTATPEQLIEMTLNETELRELLDGGFFDLINNVAGVNIDDYEDESIEEREKLEKVLATDVFQAEVTGKLAQIKSLFEEAVTRSKHWDLFLLLISENEMSDLRALVYICALTFPIAGIRPWNLARLNNE
ncbi:hypothetical protein DCC81_21320 [Chitinophaga parva]|uniref:Uncharacterized protein n=1 Tax=Chitinophaga parva TaxID=2169414 RepID=A0A2T7BCX9_9BACT|nr:hypothetical protein [Chitinophaga parva]PUZ22958.1 hypothetical protein DCC81_21320 [Chitinophaga parva]